MKTSDFCFWIRYFFTKMFNLKETENLFGPNFNLITQREIFFIEKYPVWDGNNFVLIWTILIFGTKIQRSFKFLEGVMIYNYTSGLLLDYCFDSKFTYFEPFSLFCTIFALVLHYHIRYDLNRMISILIVNLGSVKGSPV